MAKQWFIDNDVDDLEEEFEDLASVGRGRKPRKRPAVRADVDEFSAEEDRQDKRRKRRWEAPPHKRETDYEPR